MKRFFALIIACLIAATAYSHNAGEVIDKYKPHDNSRIIPERYNTYILDNDGNPRIYVRTTIVADEMSFQVSDWFDPGKHLDNEGNLKPLHDNLHVRASNYSRLTGNPKEIQYTYDLGDGQGAIVGQSITKFDYCDKNGNIDSSDWSVAIPQDVNNDGDYLDEEDTNGWHSHGELDHSHGYSHSHPH